MRVLVIEDNARLADLTVSGLERRGFSCDIAACLSYADSALGGAVYDAIVLDLGLPDGDGVGWLANRRPYRQMPPEIGRTHVSTPTPHAHTICRLLLDNTNHS